MGLGSAEGGRPGVEVYGAGNTHLGDGSAPRGFNFFSLFASTWLDIAPRLGHTIRVATMRRNARSPTMFKVEIELPETVFMRNVGGKAINLPLAEIAKHPKVIADLVVGGAKIISTNTFNGGGKETAEPVRLAQMQKRWDAWLRGEYVMVERGETAFTGMREAFIAECVAAGMTTGDAEKLIKAKVAERLPEGTKATFGNYLDASALEYVEAEQFETAADAREALEGHYAKLADEAAKRRAKVSAKLVAPTIDLSAFKKAPGKAAK